MITRPPDRPSDLPTLESLEAILRAQLESHRRLHVLLERKREALRQADLEAISADAVREQELARALDRLERRRLAVVAALADAVGVPRDTSAAQLAEQADDPLRTRLLGLVAELRPAVERSRRESGVLRGAAEALATHLAGVLQSVHGVLSAAGVYGRAGRISNGAPLRGAVDVVS